MVKGNKHPWVKTSLFFFVAQLAVNALWSLAFFGLKSPLLALGIIFVLLILIVRTIQLFIKIERFMAYLLTLSSLGNFCFFFESWNRLFELK